MGTAALVTGAAVVRLDGLALATAVSDTEPHAWHSPQRPTQRAVDQPHSLQR
jgi:hypothetical protein